MAQLPRRPKVVADAAHTGMWRVRWPDGRVSDMTNLTRAKDAVTFFIETEERRQRGRHSPSDGRLCDKTDRGMSVNLGLFKGKSRARACAGQVMLSSGMSVNLGLLKRKSRPGGAA